MSNRAEAIEQALREVRDTFAGPDGKGVFGPAIAAIDEILALPPDPDQITTDNSATLMAALARIEEQAAMLKDCRAKVAELEEQLAMAEASRRMLAQEANALRTKVVELEALRQEILSHDAEYQKNGGACVFEGSDMIYASWLEELADKARALGEKPNV